MRHQQQQQQTEPQAQQIATSACSTEYFWIGNPDDTPEVFLDEGFGREAAISYYPLTGKTVTEEPDSFIGETIPMCKLLYGATGKDGRKITDGEDEISCSEDITVCATDDGPRRTDED